MYNENHSSMELCLKSQNSLFVSFFSYLPKAYVTNFPFTAGFSRMCSKLSKQILWYFQKRVANNKYYNQIDLNMKRKNNIFAKSNFSEESVDMRVVWKMKLLTDEELQKY